MQRVERELLVSLKDGHRFVFDIHAEADPGIQADEILKNGVREKHHADSWTHHPAHQVKSVKVQPKGTGLSEGNATTFQS